MRTAAETAQPTSKIADALQALKTGKPLTNSQAASILASPEALQSLQDAGIIFDLSNKTKSEQRAVVKAIASLLQVTNSLNQDPDIQAMAIKKTTQNRPFVEIEEDILRGVPKKQWQKTTLKAIRDKFTDGVTVNGEKVAVNQRSRRELSFSDYTESLSRSKKPDVKQMLRDKLNAAYTIDEVVDATTGWTAEPAKHNRTDNIESFICGKVLLRIGSNDYEAKVEIGVTKSGQKQIHAIEEMERVSFKEKVEANPTTTASRNGIPPETVKSASTNSIVPNPSEKVNPRNKKSFSETQADANDIQAAHSPSSQWQGNPQKSGEGQSRSLSDLRKFVENKLQLTVAEKEMFMNSAIGEFMTKSENVHIRDTNDLPVLAHEAGHALDKRFSLLQKADPVIRSELENNLSPIMKSAYPANLYASEGLAEFFRETMLDTDVAAQTYPAMTQYLQTTVDARTWQTLQEVFQETNRYFGSDALTRYSLAFNPTKTETSKLEALRSYETYNKAREWWLTHFTDDLYGAKKPQTSQETATSNLPSAPRGTHRLRQRSASCKASQTSTARRPAAASSKQ